MTWTLHVKRSDVRRLTWEALHVKRVIGVRVHAIARTAA